jgi:hypothetical protein
LQRETAYTGCPYIGSIQTCSRNVSKYGIPIWLLAHIEMGYNWRFALAWLFVFHLNQEDFIELGYSSLFLMHFLPFDHRLTSGLDELIN